MNDKCYMAILPFDKVVIISDYSNYIFRISMSYIILQRYTYLYVCRYMIYIYSDSRYVTCHRYQICRNLSYVGQLDCVRKVGGGGGG